MKSSIQKIAAILTITLLTTPSHAIDPNDIESECTYLWVERNYIYAEKNYCFKSKLAQDVFSYGTELFLNMNDCNAKVIFTNNEIENLKYIRKNEKRYECRNYYIDKEKAKKSLIHFLRKKINEKQFFKKIIIIYNDTL